MRLETGRDFGAAGRVFRAIAALVLIANFSAAVTLTPEANSISSCICETNLVKLIASNPSDSIESVIMSAGGDQPWLIPGPKEYNLQPRSSKDVTAFVTPDCFAVPGKYSLTVSAKSASGTATSSIDVDVSACVQMQAEQKVSLCRGEVATAKLSIRNIARDEGRNYVLSVSTSDSNPKFVSVPKSVFVEVNSEKQFDVSIDSKEMPVGLHNFEVRAQALYEATDVPTTDVDASSLQVEVRNCENFELQAPDAAEVCAGVPTALKVKLVNKGAATAAALSSDANYITISPSEVELQLGETADVEITINAQEGAYTAKLSAKSDLKAAEDEIKIVGRECFGSELQMQAEKTVCSEFGAEYDLTIKNRETPAEYKLSVTGMDAELSADEFPLGKLESKTLKFTIPKAAASGTYSAVITAESKDAKDSITKEFSIQKCYDFRLVGPEVSLCPCEEAAVDFELINFGVKDDSFSLESESDFLKLEQDEAQVKSKEKAKLTATINSCSLEPGKFNAVIAAESGSFPEMRDKLRIDLTVKSKEQCYGVELQAANTQINSECGIKSAPVQVINRGTKETAVSLSATQGSRVTPDSLLLKPGEGKEVFLVVFPSPSRCGTDFSVSVKADSKGVAVSKEFKVHMLPEEEGASPSPASSAMPSAPSELKKIVAKVNYTNDSIIIDSLPDVKVLISGEEGTPTLEATIGAEGRYEEKLGAGTFLITLSRAGYEPLTLQVNVTGQEGGGGATAGNLGSIPLLLVAFLIIVAALYFVLRRGDAGEGEGEEAEEEEEMEEGEELKPKRGRPRKKR